jgi:anti-repressor protein
MQHLLNLREQDGKTVISARELYEFLQLTERFSKWVERMFDYGFVQGLDYTPYQTVHPSNKQNILDYALTLDCAKELSMLQRTEKGKEARQYFIECEKRLHQPPSIAEMTITVIKSLEMDVEQYRMRLVRANDTILLQAPKVRYVDEVLDATNLIPATIIAKDLGMSAKELNKKLHQKGVIYRQGQTWVLYSKYQDKGYTHSKTHTYTDTQGQKQTSIQTFWTEKGREFIHMLFGTDMVA